MHDLLQGLGDLVDVAFVYCVVTLVCIRNGHIRFAVFDHMLFGGQGISCSRSGQLGDGADITGMQLRHLNRFISLHHIEFAGLHFHILIDIVDHVIRFQNAGIYLDQGVFSDKRIYDGLPYHSGFRFREVVIRLEDLVGLHIHTGAFPVLRAREIF